MKNFRWLVPGLMALLLGGSLFWTVPARADTAVGDTSDNGSTSDDPGAAQGSDYNYDANRKPDDQVDQDQASGDKGGAVTLHHTTFDDPFQNEKIQWNHTQTPLTSSWASPGKSLPTTFSPSAGALPGPQANANAPAPLLNLPSPQQPYLTAPAVATSVPKSTQQKLKELAKRAHALAPYRYQFGTINMRKLAGNPYYHYGSYRDDAPRQPSSIGYGTLSNAEISAPTEAP